MTVYYFEGSPITAPLTIENKTITVGTESASLREFRRATEAQRWDLTFRIMTTSGAADFLDNMLDNGDTVKSMTMPQLVEIDRYYEGLSNGSAFPVTQVTNVAATSVQMQLDRSIYKGSFIQFSNHNKIYVARETVIVGHTPIVTKVDIYPSLRAPVGTSDTVRYPKSGTKPKYYYRRDLAKPSQLVFSDGILMDPGVVALKEAV